MEEAGEVSYVDDRAERRVLAYDLGGDDMAKGWPWLSPLCRGLCWPMDVATKELLQLVAQM